MYEIKYQHLHLQLLFTNTFPRLFHALEAESHDQRQSILLQVFVFLGLFISPKAPQAWSLFFMTLSFTNVWLAVMISIVTNICSDFRDGRTLKFIFVSNHFPQSPPDLRPPPTFHTISDKRCILVLIHLFDSYKATTRVPYCPEPF